MLEEQKSFNFYFLITREEDNACIFKPPRWLHFQTAGDSAGAIGACLREMESEKEIPYYYTGLGAAVEGLGAYRGG